MKITFLGTGTSHGIPAIGCVCEVCTSPDPRNYRRRTSLYVQSCGAHLVIDTPPDFREQVLRFGVSRVDVVLLTHAHVDHVNGFDDLRRFGYLQDITIPVYASTGTIENMKRQFHYVFEKPFPGTTLPRVSFRAAEAPFDEGPFRITPLPVEHGPIPVFGYRLDTDHGSLAYIPDCSHIPEAQIERLGGLDVMILDATRNRPHPTHYSLDESVEVMGRISAKHSYITHLCHDMEHEQTQNALPPTFHVPYDGLTIEL